MQDQDGKNNILPMFFTQESRMFTRSIKKGEQVDVIGYRIDVQQHLNYTLLQ